MMSSWSQDQQGVSMEERVRAMQAQIDSLQEAIVRVNLDRPAFVQRPVQWHWAKTIGTGESEAYPDYLGAVFPIVYLDPDFKPIAGVGDAPKFEDRAWPHQSATEQNHALSREYVPKNSIVRVMEGQDGRMYILTPGLRPWIRFQLSATLAATDEKVDGSILIQGGYGLDHESGTVKLYNMPISGGDYQFFGDNGDIGYALYRDYARVDSNIERRFVIIGLECP